MVFENKELKEKIKGTILFGSVAKKMHDKKSDIDLFFDIKDNSDTAFVEDNLKTILKSFEIKAEQTWNLKGTKLPISFIVGSLEEKTWENLREEIISSGVMLYGSYKEIPKNVKHYALFYYSLKNLDRKNKMKFIRKLFGYALKKDKKEYRQQGLLGKINGLKLSSNVILIPLEDIVNVKNIFHKFNVKYRTMETWIRE
jgi:predicted nucleotidyltransferase